LLDVGEKKVVATPLGLDAAFRRADDEEIAAARRRYRLQDAPYLMSVGVFEPRKNQAGLVRAFASLVAGDAQLPHRLVLAGSVGLGWRNSQIGRLIDSLGVSERVRILDALPDEQLRQLLSGADAFAYPSFYEGFGLPVLEAMACGVPVVTSNLSSMPEVGGDAPLYADPADVGQIAAALGRVLHDASLRESMVEAGLARAATFTWDACARGTLEAFAAAVER
jgi:glycosyltransferase involved in cell wall biosynthesis